MELITLAHGAGGTKTKELIDSVFAAAFQNPLLTADDAALLRFGGKKLAFTADGFVITPPFFNGGDIGKLSVCGTVNDLACMAAHPLYMTCSFIIEEGFPVEKLRTIAASMAQTAREAGIAIVAGDTKVVARGQCDGVFIAASGIGEAEELAVGGAQAREGDTVLFTGDVGRHGAAVLLARGGFGLQAELASDCAPLWGLVEAMLQAGVTPHCLRDATRGGMGTVLDEIAGQSGVTIELEEEAVPVCDEVRGVCGLLGLEPLYLACEGRLAVVVPGEQAQTALKAIKSSRYGKNAAVVGKVCTKSLGGVVVRTGIGGRRLLPPPSGELLPRIC